MDEKKRKKRKVTRTTKSPVSPPEQRAGDLMDRITPVAELQTPEIVVAYGRSGTGKTTFAATFPKPILILDAKEDGTDSIMDEEDIHVLQVDKWEDIELVFWGLKLGKIVSPDSGEPFKTVVWDTITHISDLAVLEVKARDGKDPEASMSQRLWGDLSGLMKQWIGNYKALAKEAGVNVVFLAQERVENAGDGDDEDELEESQLDPEVGPQVTPAVQKELCASAKIIIYTFIKEVITRKKGKIVRKNEYYARVGPHPYYITKVRKPKKVKAPDSIKDPSYEKLMQIKRGEYKDGKEA